LQKQNRIGSNYFCGKEEEEMRKREGRDKDFLNRGKKEEVI
jgi:hypothetical protein